jgi:hypothetical protein
LAERGRDDLYFGRFIYIAARAQQGFEAAMQYLPRKTVVSAARRRRGATKSGRFMPDHSPFGARFDAV